VARSITTCERKVLVKAEDSSFGGGRGGLDSEVPQMIALLQTLERGGVWFAIQSANECRFRKEPGNLCL
jgi:hypothetical protein